METDNSNPANARNSTVKGRIQISGEPSDFSDSARDLPTDPLHNADARRKAIGITDSGPHPLQRTPQGFCLIFQTVRLCMHNCWLNKQYSWTKRMQNTKNQSHNLLAGNGLSRGLSCSCCAWIRAHVWDREGTSSRQHKPEPRRGNS